MDTFENELYGLICICIINFVQYSLLMFLVNPNVLAFLYVFLN